MSPGVAHAVTFLFVPGDRPERFVKAANSSADVVICDLEDAVAPADKERALDAVTEWLNTGGQAVVRANGVGAPTHDAEVRALRGAPGLTALCLPKADDPDAVQAVGRAVDAPVMALVESALGLIRAREIAQVEAVTRLAFGSIDYCVDIDAAETPETLLAPRSELVLASRGAGLAGPVDGVTTDVRPGGSAGADATAARSLGFAGKLLIHPSQVDGVAAAFRPSADDLIWAERILEAVSGGGVVQVDGRMVDEPILRRARRIICAGGETERTQS